MKIEKDFTVFIAEDEFPARELLIDFVVSHPGIKLGGVARNGQEAIEKLNDSPCDILLLDVDLPVYSGIEVFQSLAIKPRVIFTTAYENYAVKAFEIGADDYLVKPFTGQRFAAAIERAVNFLCQHNTSEIKETAEKMAVVSIREKGVHYILPHDSIIYISSNGRNSIIHTEKRDYETGLTLSSMTGQLPLESFIRIHKQYTVNCKYISHFSYYSGGQYILYLKDDDRINLPVGKVYAPLLKEKIIPK